MSVAWHALDSRKFYFLVKAIRRLHAIQAMHNSRMAAPWPHDGASRGRVRDQVPPARSTRGFETHTNAHSNPDSNEI